MEGSAVRCKTHSETEAIGICEVCSAALCGACIVSLDRCICSQCLIGHNRQVMRQLTIELAISGGLFLAAISVLGRLGLETTMLLIACLMAAFLPFGWGALSRYFSTGSEYINPVSRFTSLTIHLVGAALLGIIVGPPRIYRAIREITKARHANASVRS